MAITTVEGFLKELATLELFDEQQLAEFRRHPAAQDGDLKEFAKHLVVQKHLTLYQANQLLKGCGQDLTIGPYSILELLGQGGMGRVFKARHEAMDRVVALKVIDKDRLGHPNAIKRFQREVKAAARLVHANVVLAYDAGQVDGTHYFAMEYVDGVDLGRLVRDSGPLSCARACELIRQAALGLQAAHDQGLIHRDIKPANLLVTPGDNPVVKILDMGLARLQEGPESPKTVLTKLGTLLGTPDYLAPEQAEDSSAADHRADLYSLGCTLFFLVSGRPPFRGDTVIELLCKHNEEAPPPLREQRADVPEGLQEILDRLLAKKPADRFQTAAQVAQALAPFCPGQSAGEPCPEAGGAVAEIHQPSPGTKKVWRRAGLVAATLVIASLAVLAHSFRDLDHTPDTQVVWQTPEPGPLQPMVPPLPEPKSGPEQPKAIPEPAPEPEPKPESIPRPKVEPKSEPGPEPKPVIKPEPKSEPKPELIPAPEPRPEPKTEAPQPKPARRAVPDATAITKIEAAIREENKEYYAGRAAAKLKKLVDQLLADAEKQQTSAVERFVLLQEASVLAAEVGNLELAKATLRKIVKTYAVADVAERDIVLLEKALLWGEAAQIVDYSSRQAEEMLEDDCYELALRCLEVAERAARKLPRNAENVQLIAQVQGRQLDVKRLRLAAEERETVKRAQAILASDPDDPTSNSVLGKYLCAHKEQWDEGLPLLARGKAGELRDLALLETSETLEPETLVKLGHAWQDLARKDSLARNAFLSRARFSLERAYPDLSDAQRIRVRNQIQSIEKQLPGNELSPRPKVNPVPAKVDCDAHIGYARNFMTQGRFPEAAKTLKIAATTASTDANKKKVEAYLGFASTMSLAQGAALRGRYSDASRLFTDATEQAPDPEVRKMARYLQLLAAGWRAVQTGNQREAVTAFESAQQVLPSIQMRNVLRCSCQ